MINPEYFKVKIEQFNPYSQDYKDFWRSIRRKIIEGYWVSGKYMPPQLFFYINLWHIELFKKLPDGTYSANRGVGKPLLRDIEWERGYILLEAKGFSGFSEDIEYHCIRNEDKKTGVKIPINKTYIPAREYLRKIHSKDLGKPLYQNNTKNVFDLESRGAGKSFWAASIIAHNYLTDGILDYDEYLNDPSTKPKSYSFAGAIDEIYLKRLTPKIHLGLSMLEGKQVIHGIDYPSPISKIESGSLKKSLTSLLEIKKNGIATTIGSGSIIEVATFGGSEFKAAGGRCQIMVFDEVGFMYNLKTILQNVRDNIMNDYDRFGVIWVCGTGGEMDSSAIMGIKDVFYNPGFYEFLEFEDIYEGKGKCGFFVPKYMTVNEFKDEYGNTDVDKAKERWNIEYEIKLKTKDSIVIDKFLINQPAIPSHAFLTKDGNKFPVDLIEKQIARVKSTKELLEKGIRGDIFLENGIVIFKDENQLKKRYYEVPFPYNRDKDTGYGCVTIYEFPKSTKDFVYISAMDPVAHEVGDSLPSIFLYKRSTLDDSLGDIIVAEITGRFDKFKDHLERSRLLLIFYNATCLYENSHNHFKEHMDNKFSLKYLALTPSTFSATVTLARRYGLPMSNPDLRLELEQYAYDWMLEPNPAGGINLDYIYSLNLLEELKIYDGNKTNTDRADAFIILIGYKISLTKKVVKEKQESDFYKFMNRKQRIE